MRKTRVKAQSGNALIYILIAIALFAALSFSLSRQTGGSNTKEVEYANTSLYALDIMDYSVQTKSILDQMIFSGTDIGDLDFTKPGDVGYNVAPHIHKVYHPEGGGLIHAVLDAKAINEVSTPPDAGWYLGRINNVEWTTTAATDVIITAHQINRGICEEINKSITGTATIPALIGNIDDYLVDTGTNNDLTVAACAGCEGYLSLCVSNGAGNTYSFYSVIADR